MTEVEVGLAVGSFAAHQGAGLREGQSGGVGTQRGGGGRQRGGGGRQKGGGG